MNPATLAEVMDLFDALDAVLSFATGQGLMDDADGEAMMRVMSRADDRLYEVIQPTLEKIRSDFRPDGATPVVQHKGRLYQVIHRMGHLALVYSGCPVSADFEAVSFPEKPAEAVA